MRILALHARHAGPWFFATFTLIPYHIPVLASEVAKLAEGCSRVVDCTVGGGGHAALLVESGAELFAIDRDPEALAAARERVGSDRGTWIEGGFGDEGVLKRVRSFAPDFVLLDLGVSSSQLDDDSRGFSFREGVPLDMRMTGGRGKTAAELLNRASEPQLAEIFRGYADERRWGRLARVIVRRRERQLFAVSDDLVNAIRDVLGPKSGPPDFARLFQAVRMAVNNEQAQLKCALPALLDALTSGGVLAVITYHSGEDRVVKHTFKEWARSCVCPPQLPVCTCRGSSLGAPVTRAPMLPTEEELSANPRARSAKLRGFRKANGS